jgi:hypothetical protein
MTSYDDDIDFDFFDEPATAEATQRRRLPRFERPAGGPPRPPLRAPTGIVPLARLVLLILFAIFIVVVLVLWTQSCRGAAKHDRYAKYMTDVRALAQSSDQIGAELQRQLTTPGIKLTQLESALQRDANQESEAAAQARALRPPGPLRSEHEHLIDALTLRATGLRDLLDTLQQSSTIKDAVKEGDALSKEAQLLVASDVVWNVLFHDATVDELQRQNVSGVRVPLSAFFSNPELAGPTSMVRLVQGFSGAATTGQPSTATGCPCGDELVSVVALPQKLTLTTSQPNTVKSSTDLAFQATVRNSGNVQEVRIPVTLKIGSLPSKQQTIPLLDAGQETTVTFKVSNLPATLFGAKTQVKVTVSPVPNETKLDNNSATYEVFFSLGP